MASDLLTDPERYGERLNLFVKVGQKQRLVTVARAESARRGRHVSVSELIRAAVDLVLDRMEKKNPHPSR